MASEPDKSGAEATPAEGAGSKGLGRRSFLKATGAAAGAAAVGAGIAAAGANAASASTPGKPAHHKPHPVPTGLTHTMSDLKHVVILMQENRSFDHYFSTLPGVRGLNDKQALTFQDGTTVFQQRDAAGAIHTPQVDDSAWGTDHSFTTLDGRRWDSWVKEKGVEALNYHSPGYMSFYWSLVSQFGVGDQYFCSILGPTDCNRKYHWSGMSNGEVSNTDEANYDRDWITVAEQLQQAGVDWRMFSDNHGSGNGGKGAYRSDWLGDYGDNELQYFKGFNPAGLAADDPKLAPGTGLIWRGNAQYYLPSPSASVVPDDDSAQNLEYVLQDFIAACAPDAEYPLPTVSWITAPYGWCEHPASDSQHGERYVARILEALQSNPEIWNSTLFLVNYDENDGKFDHVLPPYAEPGTPGEYTNQAEKINVSNIVTTGGEPIGLGPRVPLVMVSPWTRGGWVASEVFDHTSIIKFLETYAAHLGKPFTSPNISAWRRSIVGDLTSALDFTNPQFGPATFPEPVAEVPVSIAADHMKHRALPFHGHATVTENRVTGKVTAKMTVDGPRDKALSFQVFPDALQAFTNTPFTVTAGSSKTYEWDATTTDGKYAFSIYSNDGFVRSFAGQLVPADEKDLGIPRVDVHLDRGRNARVAITLYNDGAESLRYTLTANDFAGGTKVYELAGGRRTPVEWPTDDGYYDVIITADTGSGWKQRYAGRVATTTKD